MLLGDFGCITSSGQSELFFFARQNINWVGGALLPQLVERRQCSQCVPLLCAGELEVVLDRRLRQDDNRGLGQGVMDNKLTASLYHLLLEDRRGVAQVRAWEGQQKMWWRNNRALPLGSNLGKIHTGRADTYLKGHFSEKYKMEPPVVAATVALSSLCSSATGSGRSRR